MRRSLLGTWFVLALIGTAGAQPNLPPTTSVRTVALLPIGATGLDPIVPRRVGETLGATVLSLGYRLAEPDAVARAFATVRPSNPPSAADVWRVTALSGSDRGLVVVLRVEGGQYVADLLVASADGSGPFVARATGGPADFLDRVAEAVRTALPAPEAFDAEAARRYVGQASAAAQATAPPVWNAPPMAPSGAFGYRRRPEEVSSRFGISFLTESAIGTYGSQRVYNHILGARLDVRIARDVYLGLFGGYVNLPVDGERGSNLLGYVQIEDRIRFLSTEKVQIPLRLGLGYMPFNGAFMRFSAGLRFPISETIELGVDLLAPTFWWVPEDRIVTYDLALELTYRFGSRE